MSDSTKTGLFIDDRLGVGVYLFEDGRKPICLARCKYNGSQRQWNRDWKEPKESHHYWPMEFGPVALHWYVTKQQTGDNARKLGFPIRSIERYGTRFLYGWAIRYDVRYKYFLCMDFCPALIESIVRNCSIAKENKQNEAVIS